MLTVLFMVITSLILALDHFRQGSPDNTSCEHPRYLSDTTSPLSPTFKDAMKKMNFPWLCSNLRDVKTGEILAKTINANGEATGITKLVRYWNTDQDRIIKILDPWTDQWAVFKSGGYWKGCPIYGNFP